MVILFRNELDIKQERNTFVLYNLRIDVKGLQIEMSNLVNKLPDNIF